MKVSVYIATSLDGYIARTDGNLDWLMSQEPTENNGEKEDYGYNAFFESVDVLVMGRNTFEKAITFSSWPYSGKRVIVLSTRHIDISKQLSAENVSTQCSTPEQLYRQLSKDGAKHLYIDGGKTIQGFLNSSLVTDLIITRIPILLGSGIPLFGPVNNDIKLEHINTNIYENGLVQSHYLLI